MFNKLIYGFVDFLVKYAEHYLLMMMFGVFAACILFRTLIYLTIKREDWFAVEFEKRVHNFIETKQIVRHPSFYIMTKSLLERTYYEVFIKRGILKRRKLDHIESVSDRLFMVQAGIAWLVRDTLKQMKYLKYGSQPRFVESVKSIFQNNPYFNKVAGKLPAAGINDIINIVPGLFIISGIFGTFLGVMRALPELQGMDITNPEQTKQVMDNFLTIISFAMRASITGIFLSVSLSIFNNIFSPDKLYVGIVDRFENSLMMIWNKAQNNELPQDIANFDEHRDPLDALAELEVDKELVGTAYDSQRNRGPSVVEKAQTEIEKAS